jgi:hypothetical protein
MSESNSLNANIVLGRNSTSRADLAFGQNIVIGDDRTKDVVKRNDAGVVVPAGTVRPRMATSKKAIVIGHGALTGAKIAGGNNAQLTTATTVVPDQSICFGSGFRIPVVNDASGDPAPNSARHIMFDAGPSDDGASTGLVEAGGAPAAADAAIFIWYNNVRYALHAKANP